MAVGSIVDVGRLAIKSGLVPAMFASMLQDEEVETPCWLTLVEESHTKYKRASSLSGASGWSTSVATYVGKTKRCHNSSTNSLRSVVSD